jgi:hypothetical protein
MSTNNITNNSEIINSMVSARDSILESLKNNISYKHLEKLNTMLTEYGYTESTGLIKCLDSNSPVELNDQSIDSITDFKMGDFILGGKYKILSLICNVLFSANELALYAKQIIALEPILAEYHTSRSLTELCQKYPSLFLVRRDNLPQNAISLKGKVKNHNLPIEYRHVKKEYIKKEQYKIPNYAQIIKNLQALMIIYFKENSDDRQTLPSQILTKLYNDKYSTELTSRLVVRTVKRAPNIFYVKQIYNHINFIGLKSL